ncbi:hypothetical protein LDG_5583 [Legionella drancourtii LLAP12]|uniref:Uncharacterized protein n=1 Tax=Legionella drancourtii LLAP12 TaxID=658187 RepID=G9EK60_9GAMM|nr:hypothetical protein LDG_5583 [Legionella drancourtii LLAP12]
MVMINFYSVNEGIKDILIWVMDKKSSKTLLPLEPFEKELALSRFLIHNPRYFI